MRGASIVQRAIDLNAKIAGVVSLGVLRELQDRVVSLRDDAEQFRGALKQIKQKALGCESARVIALQTCADDRANAECTPETHSLLRLARKAADAVER